MRYLKLFENFSDETGYLKDIFLELSFDNFSVDVKHINPTAGFLAGVNLYQIDIRKTEKTISRDSAHSNPFYVYSQTDRDINNPSRRIGMQDDLTQYHFTIEQVWETIQTAIDYMKEEGYKLTLLKGIFISDEESGKTGPIIFDIDSIEVPKGEIDNKWEYDNFGLEIPDDLSKLISLRIEFQKK